MGSILVKLGFALAICILMVGARLVYIWWQFRKRTNEEKVYMDYVRKDVILKDLFWLLPITLLGMLLTFELRTNLYYAITICVLTAAFGINLFIQSFKIVNKKDEKELTEEEEIAYIKKNRVKIALGIFLFISLTIFWSKYFNSLIKDDIKHYFFLGLFSIILITKLFNAFRTGKELKKIEGIKNLSFHIVFVIALLIIVWIWH